MIGYHAVPVIADAYVKGIRGFDEKAPWTPWSRAPPTPPTAASATTCELGYVPIDKEPEAASKTVEYAYDDWTIARMAKAMGKADVATTFEKRAGNWRNASTKTGFLRARKSDGSSARRSIRAPSTTAPTTPRATPGNIRGSRHRTWAGSSKYTLGGDAATVKKLDAMFDFDNWKRRLFAHAEDIAGLIGQYIHGNEPSHHVAYMYDYAGAPWRTQARLTQIMKTQYKPTPDGLSGNDDLGQMSAWLVFTEPGLLSGRAGLERIRHRPAVRAQGGAEPAERQALHGARPGPVGRRALRRRGHPERQAADAKLRPRRRDPGRRRAGLHDERHAGQDLGGGGEGPADEHDALRAVRRHFNVPPARHRDPVRARLTAP
jgi:putative alpha-1,2-mannosidase